MGAHDRAELLDHTRIELSARGFVEPPQRLLNGHRLTVWPVGRHRVERVAHEDDASFQGNIVAGLSVRVAATVEPLVTVANDPPDV